MVAEQGDRYRKQAESRSDQLELTELFRHLEISRAQVGTLLEELGAFESYQEKVNQYIDGLDERQTVDFVLRMRELVKESPMMDVYTEFGIDPLARDLTKHPYPHPIQFQTHLLYEDDGRQCLEDADVAGFYRDGVDKIVVYIPSQENEEVLRQHLMNTEAPDDLKARLKHLSFLIISAHWLNAFCMKVSIERSDRKILPIILEIKRRGRVYLKI